MEEIFKRRLHLPKTRKKMAKTKAHPEPRYSEVLCTLNNVASWIRYSKTKIKNDYKDDLKEYFLPEPEKIYDSLTIEYRIVRDSEKTLDKDNIVFALKWLADSLQEIGYIKDDKVVNFKSYDTTVNKALPETMYEVRVMDGSDKWK